jgi:D-tyrosyl-tRNA(Tyr) deacylase
MRALIQRVAHASVSVEGDVKGAIDKGLLVFVGIEPSDNVEDIQWISRKIVQLRIFDDADGVMNLSLKDIAGGILLISQFTLHASIKKGNRPGYIGAARPEVAIPLYKQMISQLESDLGQKIESGVFGADMKVSLLNDGPVTIWMDSKNPE